MRRVSLSNNRCKGHLSSRFGWEFFAAFGGVQSWVGWLGAELVRAGLEGGGGVEERGGGGGEEGRGEGREEGRRGGGKEGRRGGRQGRGERKLSRFLRLCYFSSLFIIYFLQCVSLSCDVLSLLCHFYHFVISRSAAPERASGTIFQLANIGGRSPKQSHE